jgi:ABC-type multidrug transport system fused ATPase/permease subunit
MQYYTPKYLVITGVISSIGSAATLPIFGYLLSNMVFHLMQDPLSEQFDNSRNFWTIMFLVLCISMFVVTYIQGLSFGISSENLCNQVRLLLFENIIYKHIGWFDKKDRAPGILGSII